MKTALNGSTSLRALLDPALPALTDWSGQDLRAMLSHQLRQTLDTEIAVHVASSYARATVAELLHAQCHDDGAVEALTHVKNFAKQGLLTEPPDDALPEPVARVLYVLALCACPANRLHEVTSLSQADTVREARRCLTLAWLDADVRELLRSRATEAAL